MRFPGFEGEWERMKIGEIGDVKMCRRIFNNETSTVGDIPFFKIGSFGKNADAFISRELYLDYKNRFPFPKKGDILISAAGTIGRTVVYKGENAYYQDSNIVWINNDNSKVINEFLYYILQIVKFHTEGGTIQRLYNSILKSTKFRCSSIIEQTKISSFLKLTDNRIQAQIKTIEELKSLKTGMSQRIFAREIKFKDENENYYPDWNTKRLGDILAYEQPTNYLVSSTEYNDEFCIPVVTAGKTFVLGFTDETEGIFKKEKLPVIIFDDFTTSCQYVNFPFKTKSSAMKILKIKNDDNIKFIYEAMQNVRYEVGGHRRHWISVFSNIKILIPSLPEQQKIANFLSAIDKKIEIETQILKKLKEQKKFFLQNLFV